MSTDTTEVEEKTFTWAKINPEAEAHTDRGFWQTAEFSRDGYEIYTLVDPAEGEPRYAFRLFRVDMATGKKGYGPFVPVKGWIEDAKMAAIFAYSHYCATGKWPYK